MGMTDNTMIVDRVKAQSTYTGLVQEAFGVPLNQLTLGQIQKALATFMRAIVAGNSPYDAYQRGDSSALTSVQLKGVGIFNRRCIGCHNGPMLSDRDFHNIGLRSNTHTDFGRQNASNNALDRWAFMTSGLRDLQLRQDKLGFDGKTLTEILSNYQVGGLHRGQGEVAETLSPKMQASDLSSEETEALRQFLLFGLQSTFRTF
jgi:cytochrome c peroxidase